MTFIRRYYRPLLLLILGFAFITRIVRLNVPENYVFDEVYHAITAKLIARNDPQAFEWWNPPIEPNTAVDWLHPPLAKYTQALSMRVFGENSFGWRLSSVIFGVLVIWATAKLADELFSHPLINLLAALLAAFDGLLLVQSRVAMNDVHVTFFILLTLICYFRYRKNRLPKPRARWLLATGISVGLAMGTKWSGLFVLGTLWVLEGLQALAQLPEWWKKRSLKQTSIKLIKWLMCLGILPFVIYVLSYFFMFLQGKTLWRCQYDYHVPGQCYYETFSWNNRVLFQGYVSHFVELHRQIWWYQTTLEATHTYQSRPWQWFFNLRPVWFHVNYTDSDHTTNIYSFGNPALFWMANVAIVASLLIVMYQSLLLLSLKLNHRKVRAANWLIPQRQLRALSMLVISYLAVWLPWQLSPRIMFFYHYTPAVPLLSIILSFWLSQALISRHRLGITLAITAILIIGVAFVVWYPHWTAIAVSTRFANTIYFALPTWK